MSTNYFAITLDCIGCRVCVESCPAEAIEAGDNMYIINQDLCIGCGTCIKVCDNHAIEMR